MRRMMSIIFITLLSPLVKAEEEIINGYMWTFYMTVSGGERIAEIRNVMPKEGDVIIPRVFATNQWDAQVKDIDTHVFEGSSIKSVIIPEGVRSIGGQCFNRCDSLEKVILPIGVSIGDRAFGWCNNIKELTWPSDLKMRQHTSTEYLYGFDDVSQLTNIAISAGSSNVVAECFVSCDHVTHIEIPEGVTNIAQGAFACCKLLPQITLPSSLKSIENATFQDCYNLTNVTFLGNAPVCKDGIFENANRDLVIHVPVGSKGWDGNPESTALPKYWPFNTEGGRRIVHIGETVNDEPPVVTNYVYSTVTNYIFSTVTNEIHHYSTVTNEIFHYTTVTNVVKYVPEPGASPDAGYGINVGTPGTVAGTVSVDGSNKPNTASDTLTSLGNMTFCFGYSPSYFGPIDCSDPSKICYMKGKILRVAISDVKLDSTDFVLDNLAPDPETKATLAYWNFNGFSDKSGAGNDLVPSSGCQQRRGALLLDGASSAATEDTLYLAELTQATIECFVCFDKTPSSGTLFSLGSGVGSFAVAADATAGTLTGSFIPYDHLAASNGGVADLAALAVGTGVKLSDAAAWHHVALVIDRTKSGADAVRFYVDYQRAMPAGRAWDAAATMLDGTLTVGTGFTGYIDDLRVSKGALEPSEFLQPSEHTYVPDGMCLKRPPLPHIASKSSSLYPFFSMVSRMAAFLNGAWSTT